MRIVFVNQYFWPDVAATGQLLADLASDCAAKGWRVTVLTGTRSYATGERLGRPRRETWRGVAIRRLWSTGFGRMAHALGRYVDQITFLSTAAWAIAFGPRREVLVCLSSPPLLAVLGLLAKARGERFVYKVEDLFPDIAIALGWMTGDSPVGSALSRLRRIILSRADLVVALDEKMSSRLKTLGARRLEIVPNWANGTAIRPDSDAGVDFRRRHALEDRFVILYSGNMGLAHRFDAVAAAARSLEKLEPDVLFLFVGDGPRLHEVRSVTADRSNVRFLPYRRREALNELYNAADVHLVTLRDEVAGLLVPSKYAAALAVGKPVLLVGGAGSSVQKELREHRVGWSCGHDADAVVVAIREALTRPDLTRQMASEGRRLFQRKYEQATCTRRWRNLLVQLVDSGGQPNASDAGPAAERPRPDPRDAVTQEAVR